MSAPRTQHTAGFQRQPQQREIERRPDPEGPEIGVGRLANMYAAHLKSHDREVARHQAKIATDRRTGVSTGRMPPSSAQRCPTA
jgi:hypothetical protein